MGSDHFAVSVVLVALLLLLLRRPLSSLWAIWTAPEPTSPVDHLVVTVDHGTTPPKLAFVNTTLDVIWLDEPFPADWDGQNLRDWVARLGLGTPVDPADFGTAPDYLLPWGFLAWDLDCMGHPDDDSMIADNRA